MNPAPGNSSAPKILIVDDNPQIVELLEAYLTPLQATIFTAMDGNAAIQAVQRERPDIVLLDVMMPKQSGFEVCRQIKKGLDTGGTPVILITALNELADVERGRECGADDFLSKPVNKIELLERVESLLKSRPTAT